MSIPPDVLKSLIAALTALVAALGSYQSPAGGQPESPTTPISAPGCVTTPVELPTRPAETPEPTTGTTESASASTPEGLEGPSSTSTASVSTTAPEQESDTSGEGGESDPAEKPKDTDGEKPTASASATASPAEDSEPEPAGTPDNTAGPAAPPADQQKRNCPTTDPTSPATAPPATDPTAPAGPPAAPATPVGTGTTAAETHNWGQPAKVDEFDSGTDGWNLYDGPGHAGNGIRSPGAIKAENGVLSITGDAKGTTGGMAWGKGQKYGRWEGRVRAPASDESYNALLLLWPDAENFPVGGEIDFMEMMDHTRQKTNIFLHYSKDNKQISGEVTADATQWHNWALEWTPTKITAYLDGKEWWSTTETDKFPPGAMHLCIQLDWFPDDKQGEVKPSEMFVDWVKYYPISPDKA